MYYGDIRLGDTIDLKFTTRSFTTGSPTTLSGTPAISAYVGNGTTEITAGITLTADFDSRTGLNNVRVVATSGNGYATATNVQLVITTGTVGGVSVVGEVIGSFSIEARSALMPTTAARTLDVTATGAAGLDWGNVENPTTAVNLSATNIDTDQVVASVTGAVGSVTGAVGSVTGAVGSVTGNVGGNVTGSVGSVTGLTNATIADAVWDEDATAHQTQGTFGQAIGDPGADADTIWALVNTNLNATVSSRLASASYTAPLDAAGTRSAVGLASANLDTQIATLATASALTTVDNVVDAILLDTAEIGAAGAGLTALATQASVNTIDDFLDTEIAAILADTGELQTDWANGGRLDLLIDAIKAKTDNLPAAPAATGDIPSAASIADAVWDEAIAGHLGAGSTGEALNAAGAAGDPWTTTLPGAYGAGSAGYIIGNNVDAPISTVDTVVDAIKAKTDSLAFTVAGQVDANIQYVNDVQVTGTGASGDEWGP